MNPTIFFSVCSLFYSVLMIIILFTNSKRKDAESKIFKILTIINCFSLLCEAAGIFLGSNYERFKLLNDIILRLMLILYVLWFSFFAMFILNFSSTDQKFNVKRNKPLILIMIIAVLLVSFLPIIYNTNSKGVIIYSTGLAVQTVYYYVMLCEAICLVLMFNNIKTIKLTKYTSLFVLVILSTLAAAIQSYYPSLLLSASCQTFVLYVAYFNIKRMSKDFINGESK